MATSGTFQGSISQAKGEPLFVFGSLMDSDLLSVVLKKEAHHISRMTGRLPGYRRYRVADEAFPMIVPHADEHSGAEQSLQRGGVPHVEGVVLHPLGDEDLDRLIYFEGPGYALTRVHVDIRDPASAGPGGQLERRRRITARTFLATEQLVASPEPWDLARWQRQDKPLALHIADELMQYYGRIPSEDIEGDEWEALKDRALSRLNQARGQKTSGATDR